MKADSAAPRVCALLHKGSLSEVLSQLTVNVGLDSNWTDQFVKNFVEFK